MWFQVCDLLPGCVLGVTAFAQGENSCEEFLGSAVMCLFSKKGRLKTSLQRLKLCMGKWPDLRWPTKTPGKVPVAHRGRMGNIEQKLKQFERLDMPRCSWLDGKTLNAIKALEASLVSVRYLL
jgi:phosphatidylinositol 3-kinase